VRDTALGSNVQDNLRGVESDIADAYMLEQI